MKDADTSWVDGLITLEEEEKYLKEVVNKKTIRTKRRAEKARKDAQRRMKQREKCRKYYLKNKDKLNAKRRIRANTPKGTWQATRSRAKARGEDFTLTLDEWVDAWSEAPDVYDEEKGYYRRPFSMRGHNPQKHCQMTRIDTSKGWEAGNVRVTYRLQEIPHHGRVAKWDVYKGRPEPLDLSFLDDLEDEPDV